MHTSLRFARTAALILTAVVALAPATSLAAELRAASQASVGSNEVITNDLYVGGGSVTSSGTINGSLTTAGGSVLVTGPVSQDVTAAGGNLTILGTVGGSLRAVGGSITITSSVHNDIVAAGGQIQISDGEVGRDVMVAGGMVRVESPVKGSLRFGGGEIFINAPIGGDVTIDAQKVTLGSAAVISGNFTYKADQEVVKEDGAQIKGAVNYTPRVIKSNDIKQGIAAFLAFWIIAKLLMLLVGALVFGLLLKHFSSGIIESAFAEPLATLGRGVVAGIVIPILSVLLLITVIGIPFGILGLIVFASVIIISSLVAPLLIGSLLYKWITKDSGYELSWKTVLLGVAAYFILGLIPVIGWLIIFIFCLLSFGSVIKFNLGELKGWR